MKTVTIDGVEYVKKDDIKSLEKAPQVDGLDYCIVRTNRAGVFAGYLESLEDQKGIVINSRMIWYWEGACALSQLAVDGTNKPENCKFTVEVEKRILTDVIEVIPCTLKAHKSFEEVVIWKK